MDRRGFLAGSTALGAIGAGRMAWAQDDLPIEPLLYSLISNDPEAIYGALALIQQRGGTDLVSSLIFASRAREKDALLFSSCLLS